MVLFLYVFINIYDTMINKHLLLQNIKTMLCDDKGIHYYGDVIMNTMASQGISLNIVYSSVYSGADQRKHQSSASLAFVRGIHRGPVNSPHKWPVTRKMFPFNDVIMYKTNWNNCFCGGPCPGIIITMTPTTHLYRNWSIKEHRPGFY